MKRIRKEIIDSKIVFAGTSILTGSVLFTIATSTVVTGLAGGAAIMAGLAAFGPGGVAAGLLWIGVTALVGGAVVSNQVDKIKNDKQWATKEELEKALFDIKDVLWVENMHELEAIVKDISIKYNIDYNDLLAMVKNNIGEF